MSVLLPLKKIKINESLLGRQGTATALALPCLFGTHRPSQKRSLRTRYPTDEAEPSSPIGSYRGRRKRSIPHLILNAASLPADVWSDGYFCSAGCAGVGRSSAQTATLAEALLQIRLQR